MENTRTQSTLNGWQLAIERAPQFLSVILLFSIPFLTQPKGMDPMFPKTALTQALVFLMAGLWVLGTFSRGRVVWPRSKALLTLVLLAIWCLLTLFLTGYEAAAWAGFKLLVPLFLWYLLLHSTCTEAWKGENLLAVFMVSGWGTALWAMGQWVGWAPGPWSALVQEKFGGKPVAGWGDPESLAAYLLLVWPLGLGLMVRAGGMGGRVLWGLVTVSCLLALYLTGSSSGWAGCIVGAGVFALVLLKGKGKGALLWALGIGFFLSICLFASPSRERLREMGDPGKVRIRQEVWAGALGILQAHPLEGTGLGTFWAAFPSHAPYSHRMREEIPKVRHAQNWVLDWAAGTGAVGLLLLLGFWGFVSAQWWKLFSAHAIPPPLAAGFFGALTGFGMDGLFNPGLCLTALGVPLLFLAALPVPLSQRFLRLPGFPIQEKVLDLSDLKPYLLSVLALAAAGSLWQVKDAFERQGGDVLGAKALGLTKEKNWDEAFSLYGSALKTDPLNPGVLWARSGAFRSRNGPGDAEAALADLTAIGRIAPDDFGLHWSKFECLSTLDRRGEAAGELHRAIQAQPWRVRSIEGFRKGRELMGRGKTKEALDLYMRLVMEYPSCAPLMVDYAKCLAAAGRTSDARSVLKDVLNLDPGNSEAAEAMKVIRE